MTDARLLTWTEARIDQLKALYMAGLSGSNIASEMGGLSRNAVIGKIHRLGLDLRGKKLRKPKSERTPRKSQSRLRYSQESGRVLTIFESAEVIKLRCVDIVPLNLTLDELDQSTQCHYIAGEDLRYCGHPIQAGSSYCSPHHALTLGQSRAVISDEERQRRRLHFIKIGGRSTLEVA